MCVFRATAGIEDYFQQTLAAKVVTASGSVNEPTPIEHAIIQALAGLIAGGIVMLTVGLLRHGIEQHKSQKK